MTEPQNRGRDKKLDDSSRTGENERSSPGGQQRDPDSTVESWQGQGKPPEREYPGEGVTSHFPSDPSTGEKKLSQADGDSDEKDGE